MKAQKTNSWRRMLALLALSGSLSLTGTVLGSDGIGTGITPKLTAEWWQWVFSIPSSVHPLSQKDTDPIGADYCMVGQQGEKWFLGGVFKVVDISPASSRTQANTSGIDPVEIERECHDIPLGKSILIPVLNAQCNTAEELALGNDVPENLLGKARYLRNCAKILADAVDKNTATASFGPEDGPLNPVAVKRAHTTLPFSVTYSPDNILSNDCPDGSEAYLCEPDPNPSLAHADGYWAHVRPLKPGTYTLQTYGEAPEFEFALQITYTLTVVEPKDQ